MMTYALVQAQLFHVEPIAADARAADVAELWAQARVSPAQAMERGLRASPAMSFVVEADGVPLCMFGATAHNALAGVGVPWLVGTNALLRHRREFVRVAPQVVAWLQQAYPVLVNAVNCRNAVAVRWLRWLGFEFGEAFALNGERFAPFIRRN